ncbi:hypothetical protein P4H65_03345 [Paenibacillus chitinolyticus]|uniref:hypothetical protein n=1 Tax=Paenibacillus chitinolyticus TaxID=79263 RepID=UPI002DB783F6|nr:hypothetical protein [Paenibacillus chitinolyticus]MEC0244852.1 hypothetical protein [Paenibacillus chitinolyticus]
MNATQGVQAVQSFYFLRKRRAIIRGEKHRKKAKPIPEPIKTQPPSRCIGYVAALCMGGFIKKQGPVAFVRG